MKHNSLEGIWSRYPNKYEALSIAALEARRVIDAVQKGEIQFSGTIYDHALAQLVAGEIKYEKLSEAEMEALNREGLGETGFGRGY